MIGGFRLTSRFEQPSLGSTNFGYVGIDRKHRAVRHSGAADLKGASCQRDPLLDKRHLAEKFGELPNSLLARVDIAKMALFGLTQQNFAERSADREI